MDSASAGVVSWWKPALTICAGFLFTMTQNAIMGGYYLKARQIKDSDISHAPPHIREIWDLILRECIFRNGNGKLKRGQWYTSRDQVLDALSWNAGWRKMTYKKTDYENTLRYLRRTGMITTQKTTRGVIITVCNYEYYQDPKNYEYRSDNRIEKSTCTDHEPNDSKEGRRRKEDIYSEPASPDSTIDLLEKGVEGEPPPPDTPPPPPKPKKQSRKCLMCNSGITIQDLKNDIAKKPELANKNIDLDYYYDSFMDWSDGGEEMKVNWIATIRGAIRRDVAEGKLKTTSSMTATKYD